MTRVTLKGISLSVDEEQREGCEWDKFGVKCESAGDKSSFSLMRASSLIVV